MNEQLSGMEHEKLMKNLSAEEMVRSAAYKGYIKIGISHDEALRLLGITTTMNSTGEAGYLDDLEEDEITDIKCMFWALSSYKSKQEAIEGLSKMFNQPVYNIKKILQEEISESKLTGDSFLESLNTKELNGLYAVLARQENEGDNINIRKNIEKIVSSRFTDSNLFEDITKSILAFEEHSDICKWDSFEIDFGIPFENKESLISAIKKSMAPHNKQIGIYAIFHGEERLYIGIGRPIWRRIKAHYYASKGKDTAKKWIDFFSNFQKPLTIYWKSFEGHESPILGDRVRELIEHILQHKYPTKFSEY